MLRRILCLLCAALLLAGAVPAVSETAAGGISSYDFDLTFDLNADSFSELLRERAAGYASLINRLGLRGSFSWNPQTESLDLDATVYFTDDPSLKYPFRLYGCKHRVFITSPLINNEIILLNMSALMEFAIKTKNNLGIPLPYVVLLIPFTTEFAFDGMIQSWQKAIGTFTKSGKVSSGQFRELSGLWTDELLNNMYLQFWISGVADGSDSPVAVEIEMNDLPQYYHNVTNDKPVSVAVTPDSETWKNAAGETLFSRVESEDSLSVILSLPATSNGYIPYYSFVRRSDGKTYGFSVDASVLRDAPASASSGGYPKETAYDDSLYDEDWDDGDWEDDDPDEFPDQMLVFRASGSGLPLEFPDDASFSLSVAVQGALYPDCSFCLNGETKQDGAVTLSLSNLSGDDSLPVEILKCAGTFLPAAEPRTVLDYTRESFVNTYNVFSFNEQSLASFTDKVLPSLIRSVFSFVAAAPTAACQSFLDDLTDSGILDMILD